MVQGFSAVPLPGSDMNAENANWSGPTLSTGEKAL